MKRILLLGFFGLSVHGQCQHGRRSGHGWRDSYIAPCPTVPVPPPTGRHQHRDRQERARRWPTLLSGNGDSTNASSWPLSGNAPSNYLVRNLGNSDIAVCPRGGTCTCPENGAAVTTNGYTVQGGGGSYGFNISPSVVAYNVPTAVACS